MADPGLWKQFTEFKNHIASNVNPYAKLQEYQKAEAKGKGKGDPTEDEKGTYGSHKVKLDKRYFERVEKFDGAQKFGKPHS